MALCHCPANILGQCFEGLAEGSSRPVTAGAEEYLLGGTGMDVIEINRRAVFSHEEAQEVLPVVFRITKCYSQKVEALIERLEGLGSENESLVTSLESQVNQLIQEWQTKIQKLGALPKGLWIADFDAGDGYYCWKFPERSLDFWHRYNDGYSKRIRVAERRKPVSIQERLRKKIFTISPMTLQPTE